MTDIDARLREAYDAESLPDDVRRRTLAAIEQVRGKKSARRRRPWRFVLPVAACLVVLLALVGAFGLYQTPAAYVSISVNPAIELTVNPWGTVIGARGLNEDGETVVTEVSLDRLSYEEAIDRLVASPAFAPYLTADALVDVDIASDDVSLGDAIAEQTDRVLAKTPCQHRCHRADGTTCSGGHGAGSGPGHGQGQGQGHGQHRRA